MSDDESARPRGLPFSNIRVVDLSHAGAGPFATLQLADLGAEVIKVERPIHGDGSRSFGKKLRSDGISDYFAALNRNKSSVVVDFSKSAGSDLVRSLIDTADVVIENFRPGVLARYGLDFESVIATRPQVIYCSISAFGSTGPWVEDGGNDITLQGLSGLMAATGNGDGVPVKVGAPICDLTTGLYAALAIASALAGRGPEAGPQKIEVPMLDSTVSLMCSYVPSVADGGDVPTSHGTGHAQIVPYQAFECSDGQYLIVGAFSNRFWRELCAALDMSELLERPEYRSNEGRVEHRDELVPLFEAAFLLHARDEWLEILGSTNIPCSPVLNIGEAIVSEQALHNELLYQVGHGDRAVSVIRTPIRNSQWPRRDDTPPPFLGEQTRSVLSKELGMDDVEIDQLIQTHIVECLDD